MEIGRNGTERATDIFTYIYIHGAILLFYVLDP